MEKKIVLPFALYKADNIANGGNRLALMNNRTKKNIYYNFFTATKTAHNKPNEVIICYETTKQKETCDLESFYKHSTLNVEASELCMREGGKGN